MFARPRRGRLLSGRRAGERNEHVSDKHVTLITGASKGIGRATAEMLAAGGQTVLGMARSKVSDFPGDYVAVDLGDREATAGALKGLTARHKIDALVNNVGLVRPAPLAEVTVEQMQEVFDLNLRVALQCTQAVLPTMLAGGYGRIVNVASMVVAGVPFRTSYAAAKSALVSFTRSWALELAQRGVTVNAVSPGPTDTELFRRNNPPGSESRRRYTNNVPMKRVAPPQEVAAAIAFLLSEQASFITGQNLYVDGGSSVGQTPV